MNRRKFIKSCFGLTGFLFLNNLEAKEDVLDYFTVLNDNRLDLPVIRVDGKPKGWFIKDRISNEEIFVPSFNLISETREGLWNTIKKECSDTFKYSKSSSKENNVLIMSDITYNGKLFSCYIGVCCNVRYIR